MEMLRPASRGTGKAACSFKSPSRIFPLGAASLVCRMGFSALVDRHQQLLRGRHHDVANLVVHGQEHTHALGIHLQHLAVEGERRAELHLPQKAHMRFHRVDGVAGRLAHWRWLARA